MRIYIIIILIILMPNYTFAEQYVKPCNCNDVYKEIEVLKAENSHNGKPYDVYITGINNGKDKCKEYVDRKTRASTTICTRI